MNENRKYKYFVKYRLVDGTMNVKIVISQDPERVWMSELKEEVRKTDEREVLEIIKCRKFGNGKDGFDSEEFVY